MVATFVIFLREGIEASMIVAILLAYLDRIGKRQHFKDVLAGVAAALVLAAAGGVIAYLTIKTYAGSRTQTIFETATYALAAVVLTYMTFWMRSHSKNLSQELRQRTEAALDRRARTGLALLSFQAVGREGLESMVFTLAIVFASSAHGVIIGGVAGLAVSMAMAFAIYHLGKRIDVAMFFKAVGGLLMVFAAGLLVDTVQNAQSLGWITFGTHPLWHTGSWLAESSTVGDIFHSFFGYAQSPTVLQVVVYVVYLAVALTLFFGPTRRFRPNRHLGTAGRRPGLARQSPADPAPFHQKQTVPGH